MKEKLNFLIIDTSDENFTGVCLYMNGELFLKSSNEERGHIKNLMPLIKEVLEENNLTLRELNFISIVEGPGSWTGLRIGFATVKVLCMVNHLKLILINNFDLYYKTFENKNSSTEIAILINSSNLNYYYRYILNGTGEYSDGIASEETLMVKYPRIEKKYFSKPEISIYVEECIDKFKNNFFANVDNAEPYYISTGDLKSNFIKAKV